MQTQSLNQDENVREVGGVNPLTENKRPKEKGRGNEMKKVMFIYNQGSNDSNYLRIEWLYKRPEYLLNVHNTLALLCDR